MEKNEQLHNVRHSAAHLLAHAVQQLFPGTKKTIGPVTETGFFYDFQPLRNFKEEDLEIIEQRMRELSEKNYPIVGGQVPKEEARELFKDNPFKLELIDGIEGDTVGVYRQEDFFDLCKGGHTKSTGQVKHFKLTGISGAYWRANRDGIPLQRITGIAFESKKDLDDYQQRLEDLKLYDHRVLGKQLDLFTFHDVAPGMPFFHNKGLVVFNKLIAHLRTFNSTAYQEIRTPMIMNESLWRTSGHYDNYKENMYFTSVEDTSFCVKPMNCPGSILVYQEKPHSYRELPLRLAEFGSVHRFELSGSLHGMFRVRAFTQDDAHVYCTVDQIESEVSKMLDLAHKLYATFGFKDIKIGLSTRPASTNLGTSDTWDQATTSLKNALDNLGLKYVLQEGDGAFYGPKIDLKLYDVLGREWQCGTIQVDFVQPLNFDLEYIDSDQSRKKPVIIHRALYGSIERFFGIILEHFKGHLPFWLAPIQVRILTITDSQQEYAQEIYDRLIKSNIRAEIDRSGDQISAKIRKAQVEKLPWMLVVGQKEVDARTVTLRTTDGKQQFGITIDDIVERAQTLDRDKTL